MTMTLLDTTTYCGLVSSTTGVLDRYVTREGMIGTITSMTTTMLTGNFAKSRVEMRAMAACSYVEAMSDTEIDELLEKLEAKEQELGVTLDEQDVKVKKIGSL